MFGEFLGRQRCVDRPLFLSPFYAMTEEDLDPCQHLGNDALKPRVMRRDVERRVHEHAALAVLIRK